PQFRLINNSWDSKVGSSETLQNGRVLINHLNHNLSKASRITAVSDSSETNGYIEFIDNPSDLAGPVSQLQFTCYDAYDLDTPITDINSIRNVKVETTITNPATLGQDMTFSTQAYIRTNALPAPGSDISKMSEPWLEFDLALAYAPALCQLGPAEYLCAYGGNWSEGFARILNVNTIDWSVSASSALQFVTEDPVLPDLVTVDNSHALCVYRGEGSDGWGCIIDATSLPLVAQGPFEFDTQFALQPVLCQIDSTHFLLVYQARQYDGTAVVLSVNTTSWITTVETPFEFDTDDCQYPEIVKVDDTHYLCSYSRWGAGMAVVLTVDPATWTVTQEIPYQVDTHFRQGTPALVKLDNTHVLCAYSGQSDVGWAVVLTLDPATWNITKETTVQIDSVLSNPVLCQIDSTNFLCAYTSASNAGTAVVLTVEPSNWSITKGTSIEFDTINGEMPDLAMVDSTHFLIAYTGITTNGTAGILNLNSGIRP
ncbi:MAG: hypothetical protein ACYS6K_28300, partial [Planctomycetota bacterium]